MPPLSLWHVCFYGYLCRAASRDLIQIGEICMKKFANDLDPLDAADGAAARRRQVKCQQALEQSLKI